MYNDSHYNMYRIVGPRNISFWPPLQYYERVTIYAPAAAWMEHGEAGSYMDVYKATGVKYSYIAGGQSTAGATVRTLDRFDWNIFATRLQSSPIELKYAMRHGSGAISAANGYIFFFGGGDPNGSTSTYSIVHRLSIDPVSMRNNLAMPNNSTYGHTFTNTVYAWVCAYGTTDADNAILKYDLALENGAVITGVTDASNTRYISSACNNVIGYILHPYDNAGSRTLGYMNKVECATDAVLTAFSLAYKVGDPSVLVLFRDMSSYIWTGSASNPSILKYDLGTDTVTATFTNYYRQPYGSNAHQVVCDGENQAQSIDGALLCNATAAIVTNRHRQYNTSRDWITDYHDPIGSATDLWSMC